MQCQACGSRPATIHSTQLVGGKKSEKHLCEECFKKAGLAAPFSADELKSLMGEGSSTPAASDLGLKVIAKFLSAAGQATASKKCEQCGVTGADLQKRGLVGCAHDYETFDEELAPLIERLHGKTRHAGKIPGGPAGRLLEEERRKELAELMAAAVKAERYEDAARFRDELRGLTAQERTDRS